MFWSNCWGHSYESKWTPYSTELFHPEHAWNSNIILSASHIPWSDLAWMYYISYYTFWKYLYLLQLPLEHVIAKMVFVQPFITFVKMYRPPSGPLLGCCLSLGWRKVPQQRGGGRHGALQGSLQQQPPAPPPADTAPAGSWLSPSPGRSHPLEQKHTEWLAPGQRVRAEDLLIPQHSFSL